MYIYTHWKGKTSRRWRQWGISLSSSALALLSSPPSFEAPGIFPGSLLQPVYNRQQRASEERGSGGVGAKQDFVLIPSFFPPHSYREPVAAPMRLGCREEAKGSQIRCCLAPCTLTESLIFCARALNPIRPSPPLASLEREDKMGDFQGRRGED